MMTTTFHVIHFPARQNFLTYSQWTKVLVISENRALAHTTLQHKTLITPPPFI
jgi:hypothetical protein